MKERHIVAIDLGTSKIAITVAIINGDDVNIIYYKEGPSDGIRSSAVFIPARASKCIQEMIQEAEKELGIKISKVVASMPKYEVKQENAELKMVRSNADDCISEKEIKDLKTLAQNEYELDNPEVEVLFGAVTQAFSTEDEFMLIEKDVVGMIGGYLEGNFKVFIGRKKDIRNIDAAFKALNIEVAEKYFTPDSIAKAVLYEPEMENGVALVDFGAGVTSVSVYSGNVMRHYAAIPFGGKSITTDIRTECNITEKLAENIKLGYGVCMPERLQNLSEKILRISSNNPAVASKELPVQYLSEIITARVKEITDAILYEIEQSGLADQLKGGIVVTGGGAELANCCNLIKEISGYNVRIGVPKKVFCASDCDGIFSPKATNSLGMILTAKKDENLDCAWANVVGEECVEEVSTKVPVEEPVAEPVIEAKEELTEEPATQTVEEKPVEPVKEVVAEPVKEEAVKPEPAQKPEEAKQPQNIKIEITQNKDGVKTKIKKDITQEKEGEDNGMFGGVKRWFMGLYNEAQNGINNEKP